MKFFNFLYIYLLFPSAKGFFSLPMFTEFEKKFQEELKTSTIIVE